MILADSLALMLTHPQFDPVAIAIGPLPVIGTISIHWYGIMYLLAFMQFWYLGRHRIKTRPDSDWTVEKLDDLLFYGVLGVILGGRLGEVLFYQPSYYFSHPKEIMAIWEGGMSFHGGFLGVLIAMTLWARKYKKPWLEITDFIAPLVPLGLMAGRIGNFINQELWGRVASPDLPWAMTFPRIGDNLPRHPSQLYHASLEGLTLFLILWFYSAKPRASGAVSGMFLIGYGIFRSFVEFFREPDQGIFGHSYTISMGQWLSLPMIALGGFLVWKAHQAAIKEKQ